MCIWLAILLLNRKAPRLSIRDTSLWLYFRLLVVLKSSMMLAIYLFTCLQFICLSRQVTFVQKLFFSATTHLTWSLNMYSRVYSSNDPNSSESILSISIILEISKVNCVRNAGFWSCRICWSDKTGLVDNFSM